MTMIYDEKDTERQPKANPVKLTMETAKQSGKAETPGQRLARLTGVTLVQEDSEQVTLDGHGRLLSFSLSDGVEHAESAAIHNYGAADGQAA